MAKVAIVISLFVLFQITLASPTLPTCDEDGDTDCADGDMQCKWRKATCMMQKAAMEGTKAAYGEDFMEDRNEWVAESREALSILAHTLLGKRTRTHVVHLLTEYQQGGTPLFKIMEWGVLSLAELAALQDGHEKLVEQLEEHMKRAPVHVKEKTGTDAAVAYVVVACRSMEAAAVVVPLGVPKVSMSTVSPEDVVKVLNSGKIRPSK